MSAGSTSKNQVNKSRGFITDQIKTAKKIINNPICNGLSLFAISLLFTLNPPLILTPIQFPFTLKR